MLKTVCINPELIKQLALCGHGDKVLICDGNYPVETCTNGETYKLYLNLTQGIPKTTDVLKVLNGTVRIEKAEVMMPEENEPEIFYEFRSILEKDLNLNYLKRFEFYDEAKKPNVKLAIGTGEQRVFANILLTVGVA